MKPVHLNQYYTECLYSDRLVNSLNIKSPNLALDLGFGAGGLLHAARRRWSDINLIGVDLDKQNVINAQANKLIDALEFNGLSFELPEIVKEKYGKIDVLVSNPPYFSRPLDKESIRIIKAAGLGDCLTSSMRKIPAELIFLAQNLRMLSDTGEMGIILPAGLISGERWQGLREILFNEYNISNIIQLPVNSFKKTDAQTFIVTLSKLKSVCKSSLSISHILKPSQFNISLSEAVSRADHQYYEGKNDLIGTSNLIEGDFEILRGNLSHKNLKKTTSCFIHTSEMPAIPVARNLSYKPIPGIKNAIKGDILIARVGRRCLGRFLYVTGGSLPISDCIIAIRPKSRSVGAVIWNKISSDLGIEYIRNTSLGVGAKYVTHQSINEFLLSY